MVRSNIRQLQRAADDAAEDDEIPRPLIKYLTEIEEVMRRYEQALRRFYDE